MRRILQASGVEVIHLGHNRSVKEIVECAIQEDAQGIAITSYQGGHVEYFKYMIDLLKEKERVTSRYSVGRRYDSSFRNQGIGILRRHSDLFSGRR